MSIESYCPQPQKLFKIQDLSLKTQQRIRDTVCLIWPLVALLLIVIPLIQGGLRCS